MSNSDFATIRQRIRLSIAVDSSLKTKAGEIIPTRKEAYAALARVEADTLTPERDGELCSCGNRVAHLNRDTGKCWVCS